MSKEVVQTVKLVFEIPLSEVKVTKDDKGNQYYNWPFRLTGKFGKVPAYMVGKKVTVPKGQKVTANGGNTKGAALTKADTGELV